MDGRRLLDTGGNDAIERAHRRQRLARSSGDDLAEDDRRIGAGEARLERGAPV